MEIDYKGILRFVIIIVVFAIILSFLSGGLRILAWTWIVFGQFLIPSHGYDKEWKYWFVSPVIGMYRWLYRIIK